MIATTTGGAASAHDELLASGCPVTIRPVATGDEGRVRAFYDSLSDTSAYLRFFGIRKAFSERELRALVALRPPRGAVRLAFMGTELVGIGELHVEPTGRMGEVAFAVADGHHGEGVATLLLEDLVATAVSMGVRRLVAQTLPGNRAMLLVFRMLGLPEREALDGGVVTITMDLDGDGALQAAHEQRHRHALHAAGSAAG